MRKFLPPVLAAMLIAAGTFILYQDIKIDELERQLAKAEQVQQEQDHLLDSAQQNTREEQMIAKQGLLIVKENLKKVKEEVSKKQKN